MLATLPMYDWPEVRSSTDALWRVLRRELGVDGELDRSIPYEEAWCEPGLVFSQTCGFPLTHQFRNVLHYIATPHYAVEGCEGPAYSSFVFAREPSALADFRGTRAAVNTPDSMSGMLALKLAFSEVADHSAFFGDVILTGGHVNSLIAVRDGTADVCAIDAVVVARQHRPDLLRGLRVIATSPVVPGLPFVTRIGNVNSIRAALEKVFADPQLAYARRTLFISGLSILNSSAYDAISDSESRMQEAGFVFPF
jgi:ABC-type phosphate/phosphonate transport system substrate-binding protein